MLIHFVDGPLDGHVESFGGAERGVAPSTLTRSIPFVWRMDAAILTGDVEFLKDDPQQFVYERVGRNEYRYYRRELARRRNVPKAVPR